ncbi:DinB family protein [Dyadobacter sp. CY312]|uniref:DinB family protein n=1 Tax=Dyadobacter sp. CY312 TaxID=2907303 RepID=UPI001F175344|nr:DinB family protein [Dyadobacter sp. CY312]MCE7038733.1 DinB family protein [Dyadobacter sp. CY312]
MIKKSIERLEYLCGTIPDLLLKIDEVDFSEKPIPEKWSKKEIIGHLIDSATNNHHRFIRGQYEEIPTISYDQNKWNQYNYYQQIDSSQIIAFWTAYNRQLLELIKRIPEEKLGCKVNTGSNNSFTIEFLVHDYVEHLEHHLRQVVEY